MPAVQFVVEGGRTLSGSIRPSGNKNAALPIVAAALLSPNPVHLKNVPRIRDIETVLRRSVMHARRHPEASREYVRSHAQELAEEVIRAHIGLYVNDFTEDLGAEGLRAVEALFEAAEKKGIVPEYEGRLGV